MSQETDLAPYLMRNRNAGLFVKRLRPLSKAERALKIANMRAWPLGALIDLLNELGSVKA